MNGKKALNHSIFKLISENTSQPAFVIGGFVRDYILQRENEIDIDIVTEGSGIELAISISSLLHPSPKVSVFKRFGTAMFRYKKINFEFVGARKESYIENSRKPIVEIGTIEEDQKRRDFTINTLAFSLNKNNYGDLIDPFNGINDLNNKIIKTPLDPSITFSDDPLRMLRAVRFACQLNFIIDKNTFTGIQSQAHRISIVSVERIMIEFNKIMLTEKPSIGLSLLNELDLLDKILPELIDLKGIEDIEGKTHKDNFFHTLEVVDNISKNTSNLWLRWAALLHDIGKAKTKKYTTEMGWSFHSHEYVGSKMVKTIFKRMKLPMDAAIYVEKIVKLSSRPIPLIEKEVTDAALRRLLYDANNELEDLFVLCKADITTKNKIKQLKYINNFNIVEEKIKRVEEKDKIRNFKSPISGDIIMKTFNIKPCKEIGIIKDAIKEAILEGEIKNNYENAYLFMLEMGKSLILKKKNIAE